MSDSLRDLVQQYRADHPEVTSGSRIARDLGRRKEHVLAVCKELDGDGSKETVDPTLEGAGNRFPLAPGWSLGDLISAVGDLVRAGERLGDGVVAVPEELFDRLASALDGHELTGAPKPRLRLTGEGRS